MPANRAAKTIKPLPNHLLEVELADGRRGVFDLKRYLHLPALAAFRDEAYFSQVGILLGAATRPDGQDIAPATLALELQALHPA